MKKFILSIAIAVFVSVAINAQVTTNAKDVQQKSEKQRLAKEQQVNPQVDNINAPVIKFDKLVHDYGTIEQNSDGTCEFTFTNMGKEPLILTNVKAS